MALPRSQGLLYLRTGGRAVWLSHCCTDRQHQLDTGQQRAGQLDFNTEFKFKNISSNLSLDMPVPFVSIRLVLYKLLRSVESWQSSVNIFYSPPAGSHF